jgi:prefoldin subunit 5
MTKETLEQANSLYNKIQMINNRIASINQLRDDVRDESLKVRSRGFEFEIPKASLRQHLIKEKNDLDTQLATLQAEFDAL